MHGAYIREKKKKTVINKINPLLSICLTKHQTIYQLMVKAKYSVNRTFSLLVINFQRQNFREMLMFHELLYSLKSNASPMQRHVNKIYKKIKKRHL